MDTETVGPALFCCKLGL